MLFLLENEDDSPRRFRRVGPCRRFAKGGSNATTSTTNQTQDNKRTVTGEATNVEGDGNTLVVERADAGVLNNVTQLLGDVSLDNTTNLQNGLKLAESLGVRTLDSADKQVEQNKALTDSFINYAKSSVDGLQNAQSATLNKISDAFNTAKNADAIQLNDLAQKGLYVAGALGVAGLVLLILKKK